MKHFVFLLALPLIFLICIVSGQDLPSAPVLESTWDIFTPVLFFCSEGADFIFRFGMSDYVEDYHIDFALRRGDNCDIDIWNNNYLVPTLIWDEAPTGDGKLVRQVLVALQPNINLLAVSPIYTVSEDGSTGSINFCIKITLYTKDRSDMVNFKEVKYKQDTVIKADVRKLELEMDNSIFEDHSDQSHRRLAFDCSDGYEGVFENWWNVTYLENGETIPPNVTVMAPVDPYAVTYDNVDTAPENITDTNTTGDGGGLVQIVIAPQNSIDLNDANGTGGGGESFEESFLLIAYECDANNFPTTTITPLQQGDTIRICVEPDQKSLDYGFVMKQMDSTYYSRDDIPGLIQYAVEGGQPDFYGMSEIECIPGSLICAVETTIRAEFFASPGMVNVGGAASFQWNWERRRNLNEKDERDLQALDGIDVNDIGRFNLALPLTTFQETMDMKAKGPSSLQSFLLIILSFTLILASSVLFWIKDTRRLGTHRNDDDDDDDDSHLKKNLAETYKTEVFHDDVHDDDTTDDDYCEQLKC